MAALGGYEDSLPQALDSNIVIDCQGRYPGMCRPLKSKLDGRVATRTFFAPASLLSMFSVVLESQ
jgi:hypothetical protein